MSTTLGEDRVIRRAIATVCLSGTLEDKLDAVGGAGFDGVEIFENDLSRRRTLVQRDERSNSSRGSANAGRLATARC